MIYVCNKKNVPDLEGKYKIINIMRPNVLANIYSHNPNTAAKFFVDTRKEAVALYKEYFLRELKKKGDFRNEVIRIYKLAKEYDIYLLCCCKPLLCHGDIIKEFLRDMLKDEIFMKQISTP